ncbi:dihydroorotate dehydrogenase electron transfer subunit [Salisediminibacterium halotolerans]|uniref:Dihydroorotate dehydrogenase electron transfer subunit n=1 Tax=Salisediminibacterium halotolerans TaxID=517425 RepID=A0A1H9QKJ6_9BACI|nr:dihydroorotate dehydrogenase electron transfer subunit [Salisediminibacterium haloalkalitolerans]SER60940.1 dihydroorotate dehydrogenase electron transfer subunit [Salisediminibacterium haloalkalitolerans]
MKQHHLPILSNVQISSRYWHMTLDMTEIDETIDPGQFFHIRTTAELSPFLRRPLSIYRINEDNDTLEFLYLVKGMGTIEMTKMKPGETADLLGPLGHGFNLSAETNEILLTARGVGVATLAALAQDATEKGVGCTAILSARSRDDLLSAEMLTELGVTVYKVTEEDGTSDVADVERMMRRLIEENGVEQLYTCGSRRLSRLNQQLLDEYGLSGEIALEEQMGCAMGACFSCVSPIIENGEEQSVRVCYEGPVFPLEKVVIS